jgi:Uma2 family endonuclease
MSVKTATPEGATSNGRAPAVPTLPIWRLSVEQYHEMIERGILTEDDPVELLEGWLIPKVPKKPRHSAATRRTRSALEPRLPKGWFIDIQEPITLADSEPEPDNSVVRGDKERYDSHHPGAKDVGLVVEVSEASLHRDRGAKKRIYAEAHIPVYWIVNLIDDQVEVHTDPTGPAARPDYRKRVVYRPGQSVPLVLGGKTVARIPVRDLLP